MRLIDADKLIELMVGDDNRKFDAMQCDRYAAMVGEQPTAFDIDALVKHLIDLQDIPVLDLVTIQSCLKIVESYITSN